MGCPHLFDMCFAFAGLDSFQAEKVVRTLQKLAQDGHTVVRFMSFFK
jgi:hypothetical protein